MRLPLLQDSNRSFLSILVLGVNPSMGSLSGWILSTPLHSTTSIQTFSDAMHFLLLITLLATFGVCLSQSSPGAALDIRSCNIPDNETHQTTLPYRFTLQFLFGEECRRSSPPTSLNNKTFYIADNPDGFRLSNVTQTFSSLVRDRCSLAISNTSPS